MQYFESKSISFLKDILRNIEFLLNIHILSAQKPNIICFLISFFFFSSSEVSCQCHCYSFKDNLLFHLDFKGFLPLVYSSVYYQMHKHIFLNLYPLWNLQALLNLLDAFHQFQKILRHISSNASAIFSLVPFCNSTQIYIRIFTVSSMSFTSLLLFCFSVILSQPILKYPILDPLVHISVYFF